MTKSKSKEFTARNSLLTDLLENQHVQTLYNSTAALLVLLLMDDVITGYVQNEGVVAVYELIRKGFDKFYISLTMLFFYFCFTCLLYFCFVFWARYRNTAPSTKIWDGIFILLILIYYTFTFVSPTYLVFLFQLPLLSSGFLLLKVVILWMKSHSFVRSNVPRILQNQDLPQFSHYLYFLLVPLLIYCDDYPRKEKINWKFVTCRFLETAGALILLCLAVDKTLNPLIQDFGLRKYTLSDIILGSTRIIFVGALILICVFFLILHCWANLVAELIRFGDRYFYNDWWTCTNYPEFYKKWNVVVQDWMYFYIYKDLKTTLFCGNRTLSKITVFVVSSCIHDWVLGSMFGLFLPVFLVIYSSFGTIFLFTKVPKNGFFNALFLCGYSFGVGIISCMYGMEYYARTNDPVVNGTVKDYIVPRFLNSIVLAKT